MPNAADTAAAAAATAPRPRPDGSESADPQQQQQQRDSASAPSVGQQKKNAAKPMLDAPYYFAHKRGRGLHSSTSQLNLSAVYGMGGARRGRIARGKGVCKVFSCVRHGSS
jgi:hypothetical protein